MQKKFYQKTRQERLMELKEKQLISKEEYELLLANAPLSDEVANHLVENQISQVHLPLGLAFNLVIDGEEYHVPMAVEEPSVIAACSFGAKIVKNNGGFQTKVHQRLMIGQMVFENIEEPEAFLKQLASLENEFYQVVEKVYPSIVKRGGGLRDIQLKIVPNEWTQKSFVALELFIDVKDAMGANIINTILEGVAEFLVEKGYPVPLLRILSNYATSACITATCEVEPADLVKGQMNSNGLEIARKIEQATHYANQDVYRAVTHNKGIMNGVDAVLLASGNDWRALESACHAYACRNGRYQALSNWQVTEAGKLKGELTLPLPVAFVGGAVNVMPQIKAVHHLLKVDNATDLGRIIVAVGLAQNLAALRALVSEGIQKGHMSLQIKSLALTAGAKGEEVEQVVAQLKKATTVNLQKAKEILVTIRQSS